LIENDISISDLTKALLSLNNLEKEKLFKVYKLNKFEQFNDQYFECLKEILKK
jgi:hypothetical protein